MLTRLHTYVPFHGVVRNGNGNRGIYNRTKTDKKASLQQEEALDKRVAANSTNRRRSTFIKILFCFSMLKNGEKLLSLDGEKNKANTYKSRAGQK